AVDDRGLERIAQRFVQASRRFLRHPVGKARRAHARAVERLVGVDVPYACDRFLVKQDRLHWSAPFAQAAVKVVGGELRVEGLRTEAWHLLRRQQLVLGAQQQSPEATWIAIPELP